MVYQFGPKHYTAGTSTAENPEIEEKTPNRGKWSQSELWLKKEEERAKRTWEWMCVYVCVCMPNQNWHLPHENPPGCTAAKQKLHSHLRFLIADQNRCHTLLYILYTDGGCPVVEVFSFCSCKHCCYIWQQGIKKVPALGLQLETLLIHNNGFVEQWEDCVCVCTYCSNCCCHKSPGKTHSRSHVETLLERVEDLLLPLL